MIKKSIYIMTITLGYIVNCNAKEANLTIAPGGNARAYMELSSVSSGSLQASDLGYLSCSVCTKGSVQTRFSPWSDGVGVTWFSSTNANQGVSNSCAEFAEGASIDRSNGNNSMAQLYIQFNNISNQEAYVYCSTNQTTPTVFALN